MAIVTDLVARVDKLEAEIVELKALVEKLATSAPKATGKTRLET